MIDIKWVSRDTYRKPLSKRRVGKRIRAMMRREAQRLKILARHCALARARHEAKKK
jgi:hypothetical protein